MPRDVNLRLANSASPITAAGVQAAVDTEGGFRADVVCELGVITDADETFSVEIEASIDGGTTYFPILRFEIFTNDDESRRISRPVYVPRPASGQTVTKVRANTLAVAGTTPSLPVNIWLEPLVSIAPPAADEDEARGLAYLYT